MALDRLLGPLDPGSQKCPDVTHSPEGLTRILAAVLEQHLLRPLDSVAGVMGTFLSGQRLGTQLFPSLWGRKGLS